LTSAHYLFLDGQHHGQGARLPAIASDARLTFELSR
jgi:hypothetical protein